MRSQQPTKDYVARRRAEGTSAGDNRGVTPNERCSGVVEGPGAVRTRQRWVTRGWRQVPGGSRPRGDPARPTVDRWPAGLARPPARGWAVWESERREAL